MFKKVLIVEDVDYMSSGIISAVETMNISEYAYAQYCDEALLKFKRAQLDDVPFDLVISDLSFKDNPNPQKIADGATLLQKLKELDADIKTMVFSIEDKPHYIQTLCNDIGVDAYVWKFTHGQKDLQRAIQEVYKGEFYISQQLKGKLHHKDIFEITAFDTQILQLLAQGMDQKEVSAEFKNKGISPSSLSSIEKRLKLLKENFNANNLTQLIAVTKDFGVI